MVLINSIIVRFIFLEVRFAIVLHGEDKDGDGQTAGIVVAGDKGGDLPTYYTHSNLNNIVGVYHVTIAAIWHGLLKKF